MRKLKKIFLNDAEVELDMIGNKMIKISWGGYKSLEFNNIASYRTNFYVDDA